MKHNGTKHDWLHRKFKRLFEGEYKREDLTKVASYILTLMNIPHKNGNCVEVLKLNWTKALDFLQNKWGV